MPRLDAPVQKHLDKAITKAFKKSSGDDIEKGIVTGWVLVTEHMSLDGQRYLSAITDPTVAVWTAIGMLAYGSSLIGEYAPSDDPD